MQRKDTHIPQCIGVIIDGNRRWAKANGKITHEGHKTGYERLKAFLGWAKDAGVEHVIVYTFSTENWNRSEEEVGNLMKLLRFVLEHELSHMKEHEIRVKVLGERARFGVDIQKLMERAEEETAHFGEFTATLALSYGGRSELVNAAKTLLEKGVAAADLTEEVFEGALWTSECGIPDPDLIIRTGGEKRLSNFLPWQSTYSELFFRDTLWPDFSKEEFETILAEYQARDRRRGK